MTADLLSAIVLLDPAESPGCIEDVLLSLAVQDYGALQIIIVCNEKQMIEVQAVAKNQQFPSSMHFEAIALPHESKDNNANRLNNAIKACNGQYVSVLKTNDIVYGFAFERLIDVLQNNAEPVAVGGTRNAYMREDGYLETKTNHSRVGKRTSDIWFDEDCARNFVIDKTRIKGILATEAALDYFETYFLLLALSLHNEFNFSLAGESLFERRTHPGKEKSSDDREKLILRAHSKIIDWKSAQLTDYYKNKSQ